MTKTELKRKTSQLYRIPAARTAYGTMLNDTANGDYGKSFKNINATQKAAVLKKVGSGTNPPIAPVPELKT